MDDAKALVERYWHSCNARDWGSFAATLHPDVEYRVPQTRELIRGVGPYVAFNAGYPGDWTLELTRIVADGDSVVTSTAFHVERRTQTGICFFTVKDGLLWRIEDWWPEDYEAPPRNVAVERY